jgi:hypothetical protein
LPKSRVIPQNWTKSSPAIQQLKDYHAEYSVKRINSKRTNNKINKWANEFNTGFSEEAKLANKYMKKCSTSLVKKEMQIKTTLRFHLSTVRMVIIKQTNKQ